MNFVTMVDQFSGFPMVQKLPSVSSSAVIRAIAFYFNLFGNPRMIIQDQGKQLTSWEFKEFLKNRGIKTSSSRGYDVKIGESAATTRDRKHLRPTFPDKHLVIPDDWISSELDEIDPVESATGTPRDEWPDSDEDTYELATEPHLEQPLPPAPRRSDRIAEIEKKSCQSCVGCKLIHNYLNVIDNFKVSVKKLPQILSWALPKQEN